LNATVEISVQAYGSKIAEESLGTVISSTETYTHNHYSVNPETSYVKINGEEVKVSFEPVGPYIKSSRDITNGVDGINIDVIGQETSNMCAGYSTLPRSVSRASIREINGLKEGMWLDVVYKDEKTDRKNAMFFQIASVDLENSVIVFNDPRNIITRGDSGGGVFINGRWLGNTWTKWEGQFQAAIYSPNVVDEQDLGGYY
jgi:hypothetical protein